jgi:asparaginyl-tRNA synthetase
MEYYIEYISEFEGQEITLKGWVANKRTGKGLVFIVLRDGTGFSQCVVSADKVDEGQFAAANKLTLESSVEITGNVIRDERQVGGYELEVTGLQIMQIAEEYPIAKKEHGVEFLMDKRHLWLRSKRQWAIMRIRNKVIYSIHQFFQDKGFIQMDAPIFTGNAVEGTSTLFETDFYGQPGYLSQSGQLYGEAMAMAMGRIYTFGPTFRAEKSKTRRHLSEFWMIEPEMAYYDNDMNMDLIEEFVRFVVRKVIADCVEEMKIIDRDVDALLHVDQKFPRMSYDQAVRILKGEEDVEGRNTIKTLEQDLEELKKTILEKQKEIEEREALVKKGGVKKGVINFNLNKVGQLKNDVRIANDRAENIPQWIDSALNFKHGNDFGGSDETVLTRLFEMPVMVYNWPKDIKAFYMKRVEDDDRYVKGVDVLAPEGFGEIIGGAERETDKGILIERIKEEGLPMEAFQWYLDLRKYGSVPHAGFGLGLERLVAWICNLHHVRESIPFPRMYGRINP